MPRDARSPLVRSAAVALDARPDRDLLARFAADRDDAAFAALVRRHGPLVLAVCRRHLGNPTDAEDAFQAVFLVLAKKADAVRWGESARGWVYRVAVRVAKDARNRRAVRLRHERAAALRPPANPVEPADFAAALDAELAELPDKYRDVLVACCLDGKSRDEAAADLGVPAGTVKIRLERGRELLRKRLTARGVEFGAALAAATVAADAVAGAVVGTTSRAAAAWLAGDAGAVPASSQLLADGVCRAMFVQKIRAIALGFVAVAAVAAGVGVVFGPGTPVDPTPPAAALAPVPEDKLKPGQKAVSKPDKNGLVTVLRPLVTHLAPGDPVRVVVHIATESGPVTIDHPLGKEMIRADEMFASLTFTVTTPDGKTHTLKPDFKPAAPENAVRQELFRIPTQVVTLTETGVVRNVPNSAGHIHPGTVIGFGDAPAAWVGKPAVSFAAPGRYTIAVTGAVGPRFSQPIPFASAPLTIERLADKSGVESQADLARRFRADLVKQSPDLKLTDESFVFEDARGRIVRVRTKPDEQQWHDCIAFTAAAKPDGSFGPALRTADNSCVAAGTLVAAAAGPVPIERVRVGDRVWGFDPDTGARVLTTVRIVWPARAAETLVFGGTLRVTGTHPLFANGKWTAAADVRPADELLAADGSHVPAGEPRRVAGEIAVFDLTVDEPHTFFAGGFLVHNKKPSPPPPGDLTRTAYFQLWPGELPAKK